MYIYIYIYKLWVFSRLRGSHFANFSTALWGLTAVMTLTYPTVAATLLTINKQYPVKHFGQNMLQAQYNLHNSPMRMFYSLVKPVRRLTVVLQAAIITKLNALLFPSLTSHTVLNLLLTFTFLWTGYESLEVTAAVLDLHTIKWGITDICSKNLI